ncbi:hypothetical protein HBZS_114980 [Helicobacter bizzozeronii CCUG 35545]|nr:hypothetical protein HBZS_114980 [Helicobacter bizzozeronii CCUG 35545]
MLLGATTAIQTKKEKRERETTQINQVATATQEKDTQEGQGGTKNEASPQAQGQDTQSTPQNTHDTQTEQQQGLGTSKPSNPKVPQKTRGRKPKNDK